MMPILVKSDGEVEERPRLVTAGYGQGVNGLRKFSWLVRMSFRLVHHRESLKTSFLCTLE